LQDYVIATCAAKILGRLQNSKISRPFINSLDAVPVSSIKFMSAYKEDQNDMNLCLKIPRLAHLFTMPKLLEQCEAATADKSFRLYTVDTCVEFHGLLLFVFKSFQTGLEKLNSSRSATTFSHEDLSHVAFWGNTLWSLARSGAIESHLQAIKSQLSSMKIGDIDTTEDVDVDLEAVHPSARVDNQKVELWKSYRDWLVLMVAHFDGVAILRKYVTGSSFPYKGISIRVVSPPPVTETLLHWEELLQSTHFPVDSASDEPFTSNEDIIRFLRKAQLMRKTQKSLRPLLLKPQSKKLKKHIDSIISQLRRGLSNDDDIIINQVDSLNSQSELPQETLIRGLIEILEPMTQNNVFFDVLDKLESRTGFIGVEHCEALLAVLITCSSTNQDFAVFKVRCVCLPPSASF